MGRKGRKAVPRSTRDLLSLESGGQCSIPFCVWPGTEVHHIDSNPTNNEVSNLVLLCRNHHGDETYLKRFKPSFFRSLKRKLAARSRKWNASFVSPITDLPAFRADVRRAQLVDRMAKLAAEEITPKLDEAKALIENKRYAEATRMLLTLRRRVQRMPQLWKLLGPRLFNGLGVSAFGLGRAKTAELCYLDGLSIQGTWQLHANISNLYIWRDDFESCLTHAKEAYRLNKKSPQVIATLGGALWATLPKARKRALRLLRKAHELDSKDSGIALNLARSELVQGDADRAIRIFEETAQQVESDAMGEMVRGLTYQLIAYRKMGGGSGLEFSRGMLYLDIYLSDKRPDAPEEVDKAIAHFDRALQLSKSNPLFRRADVGGVHFDLGACWVLKGRYGRAFHHFREALALGGYEMEIPIRLLQILNISRHSRWAVRYAEALPAELKETIIFKRMHGIALLGVNRYKEAIPIFREVAKSGESKEGDVVNLASALVRGDVVTNEFHEAFKLVHSKNDLRRLLINVVLSFLDRGECGSAYPYLKQLSEIDSESLWVREQLARVALVIDGSVECEKVLSGSEPSFLKEGGSLAWAALHVKKGNFDQAKAHLRPGMKPLLAERDRKIIRSIAEAGAARDSTRPIDMGCRIIGI